MTAQKVAMELLNNYQFSMSKPTGQACTTFKRDGQTVVRSRNLVDSLSSPLLCATLVLNKSKQLNRD